MNIKYIDISLKEFQTIINNIGINIVLCINENLNINSTLFDNNCISFGCFENWKEKQKNYLFQIILV